MYYCSHLNVFRRVDAIDYNEQSDEACLWHLYKGNFKKLNDTCHLRASVPQSRVLQVGPDKYLLFSPESHFGNTICDDGHTLLDRYILAKYQILPVRPGCMHRSKYFEIFSPYIADVSTHVKVYDAPHELKDMLKLDGTRLYVDITKDTEVNMRRLQEIERLVKEGKWRPDNKAYYDFVNPDSRSGHSGLYALMGGIGLLVLALVIFIIYIVQQKGKSYVAYRLQNLSDYSDQFRDLGQSHEALKNVQLK